MRVLREAFDYQFSSLDPMSAHVDPPAIAVYETLLVKGIDGHAEPGLGRVHRISDDGLSWTIKLRPGAAFHSGAPVTARAVIDSLNAVRWYFGDDRQLWYWDAVDDVLERGPDTVEFTLHHPYPRLTSLLWGTHTAIFNRELQLSTQSVFGETLADGTGPYRLVDKTFDRIVVERNPAYDSSWGSKALQSDAPVDRIEWYAMTDPADRADALCEGKVDVAHGLDASGIAKLGNAFNIYRAPQGSNMYLGLNFDRSDLGFDDVRMRRILSQFIDRAELVQEGFGGLGTPTAGPLAARSEFYSPSVERQPHLSLAEARSLLEGLGWRSQSDGVLARDGVRLSFECVVQDDHYFRHVAGALEQQLARLGIELNLQFALPFAQFYEACGRGPAAFVSKWLWQDSMEAVTGFASSAFAGITNWSNARCTGVDIALSQWRLAAGDEELRLAADRFQEAFADELPYVPLLTPDETWAWTSRLSGWQPSSSTLYPSYERLVLATGDEPPHQSR